MHPILNKVTNFQLIPVLKREGFLFTTYSQKRADIIVVMTIGKTGIVQREETSTATPQELKQQVIAKQRHRKRIFMADELPDRRNRYEQNNGGTV
jgi:hypothetical protein